MTLAAARVSASPEGVPGDILAGGVGLHAVDLRLVRQPHPLLGYLVVLRLDPPDFIAHRAMLALLRRVLQAWTAATMRWERMKSHHVAVAPGLVSACLPENAISCLSGDPNSSNRASWPSLGNSSSSH